MKKINTTLMSYCSGAETLSHLVSWQPHGDDKSPGSHCSQPRNTVEQNLTDLCLMLIKLGSFLSTDLSKRKYIYVQCL